MSTQSYELAKPHSRLAGAQRSLGRTARFFATCLEVAEQRRQLVTLDERALKDIGLSPEDVQREAARGFWDLSGVPYSGRG